MAKTQPQTLDNTVYFSQQQSKDLLVYLLSLAENEREIESTDFLQLEEIYSNGTFNSKYHHFYKDIYSVLSQVSENNLSIDVLGSNIERIEKSYTKQRIDIRPEIEKLYDHLNLEISRLNYSVSLQTKTESLIDNLKNKTDESTNRFTELEEKSNTINEKLDKAKIDYIAILGIFASVILAFVGTFTFSTSVLSNINSVSIYRLVFVAGIIGLVFFDTIFTLLQYITNFPKSIFAWITFIVFNSIFVLILIFTPIIYWHNNESPEPVPQVINIFEQVQDK